MLLKSSSTSVIHSIFSESLTRDFDHKNNNYCAIKIKFIHGEHHLSSSSCNSSPAFISRKAKCILRRRTFCKFVRRAQSDSDLEGLMSTSIDMEEVYRVKVQQSSASDADISTMLHSEPSFSIYNNTHNQDSEDDKESAKSDSLFKSSVTIGDQSEALSSGEFTFGNKMGLIEEEDVEEEEEMENEKIDMLGGLVENLEIGTEGDDGDKPSLYLAGAVVAKDIDENGDLGRYYRRILKEEPSNPLFLSNYAQFLQCQGDISGAEEYYYRATLADPKDGEILMQYAKLVWELHRDQDKAESYFERAVSAASEDSHVQAAYVRFLWEIDESDEENDESSTNIRTPIVADDSVAEDQKILASSPLHLGLGLGLDAQGFGYGLSSDFYTATSSYDKGNIEDHYKKMIEGNPRDPLYLRNYADFLYHSKGDLAGAEEYYARATLVDPSDGEIVSQYAKLVWQLQHNKDKATTYFERAVQASPENSNVLGAYAKFLWEVGEDEEE